MISPVKQSRPRKLDAMLNVRTTRQQLDELQAVADHHGVELAYVVRRALHHGRAAADREIDNDIDRADRGQADG